MQTWRSLVPTSFPRLAIGCETRVLLRPRGLRDAAGRRLPAGPFRPDGSAIDPDVPASRPAGSGPVPSSDTSPDLAGTWVYGGIALNHFGHVLVETGARLWAVDQLVGQGVRVDGLLFQRKRASDTPGQSGLPRTTASFLAAFSPGVPVLMLDGPAVVERLHLPEPGITLSPDRFVGTPEYWTFLRNRTARVAPADGPTDIYVSRSGEGARGGFLFEADLEAVMQEAGYRIFHPQHHSITEQIATYRSARRLVSIDGSALHLAAAALPPDARVAVLARRDFYAWAIADQLRTAAGCRATVIDARASVYNFAGALASPAELSTTKGWSSSFVLPDFPRLGEALARGGFLASPPTWPVREAVDLEQELTRASTLRREDLLPVPDSLLALQPHFGAHLQGAAETGE